MELILMNVKYDDTQTQLVDGRVSVNYESILKQLEEDERVATIVCGDNPNTDIAITISDGAFHGWEDRELDDKAFIVDTAFYLHQEYEVDKNTIDYGDIMTGIIFGA